VNVENTCPHEWVLPGVLMPEGYWTDHLPVLRRVAMRPNDDTHRRRDRDEKS